MKINRYRIKKAYQCYTSYVKRGGSSYWSFRLALWWFSSGFEFEGDKR
jgi:hypothetical protein